MSSSTGGFFIAIISGERNPGGLIRGESMVSPNISRVLFSCEAQREVFCCRVAGCCSVIRLDYGVMKAEVWKRAPDYLRSKWPSSRDCKDARG